MTTSMPSLLSWMSQLAVMRDAVRGIWTQFLAAQPESRLTIEQWWLAMQLLSGPQTREQLQAPLALFVDQPDELIDVAAQTHLIELTSTGYMLPSEMRAKFHSLMPMVQQFNQRWRDKLFSNGIAPDELSLVLAMLQGRE